MVIIKNNLATWFASHCLDCCLLFIECWVLSDGRSRASDGRSRVSDGRSRASDVKSRASDVKSEASDVKSEASDGRSRASDGVCSSTGLGVTKRV
ncbi:hypothetical protein [Flavobacterium sp.]|uniref:hypothetical protein n=1 Tax=Flavobacterium sp. TaxID=239 RepID=UPI0025D3E8B1|nr:hypothetical protein [Flavobacterium sp.]